MLEEVGSERIRTGCVVRGVGLAKMSSSSPMGNPSILRKAGSFSFSRSFSRKYAAVPRR